MALPTFVFLVLLTLSQLTLSETFCPDKCDWLNWQEWGSCSRTCGGGEKIRYRGICCKPSLVHDHLACLADCHKSDDDSSSRSRCGDVCYNGGVIVPDSSSYCRRCRCSLLYAGRCCDTRTCSWDRHYCWPGRCSSNNNYASSCQCASGFYKVTSSSQTTCQLRSSNRPTIQTCETAVKGPNGKMKQAPRTSSSTACSYLTDFYGNFQPRHLIYDLYAEFSVDIGLYKTSKPKYIHESNFGVTDVQLQVNVQRLAGSSSSVTSRRILTGKTDSSDARPNVAQKFDLPLSSSTAHLADGDWLCVHYEAKGGGYLISVDLTTRKHSSPVAYTKTKSTRRLCYRYDISKPKHCIQDGSCSYEPLQISNIITRSPVTTASFLGWKDPVPTHGNNAHASGIESYQITVNEVTASKNVLKVDTGVVYTKKMNSSTTSINLNLTSEKPKLYAIYLEVKDVADNVRQTRRFVLFDNSSTIDVNPNKTFQTSSASSGTNFMWQTHHHDICLTWKDYFYNKFYLENPLLNPVESDPSGLIDKLFDQQTGKLPITGTPNIYGIINFKFSWSLNDGKLSSELDVPHFQRQNHCHSFNLRDGETYHINIEAIDIASNSYTENRTVHIDRSVPHINNIWLVKDDVHRLFVHDRTDLSEMKLYFEALDPHSGIREMHWVFGTSDSGSELLNGSIGVNSLDKGCSTNSSADDKCYCPDVGKCELYQYTLPMNKLVQAGKHEGDHNRNYFFTIKVVNHALLSNIEHLDILVDDSPPEKGVIFEGPESSPDFDYTSDDSFIVHWHGFIDHESGIKFYKIALSDHCLTKDNMSNATLLDKLLVHMKIAGTEALVRLPANFTGKMYTTIVAVNNAMDMSDPVCSDGITRDISAPHISNITLQSARWSESLLCLQGHAWILSSELKKVQLHNTTTCANRCSNFTDTDVFPATVPTTFIHTLDDEISDFRCSALHSYNNPIIYMPDDHIYLQWDVQDAGSQTNEYYVGIGLDASEASNPSQFQYTSTDKKTVFNKHHTGIGSSEIFYIFLKAENKAGLTRISTVGPLLIDQTPPLSRTVPDVNVEHSHVMVTWHNDTFYDMEQTELIDQIYFQFTRNGQTVTPMMEWRQDTSSDCSGHLGFCIKYPVEKLQRHATEFGFDFHISLFVYNKAGHFLRLDTEKFRLPSKYPPGHATVLDVDPRSTDDESDVDVNFSEATLCAKWTGFHHHENITLEFGIGSSTQTDDVIPFSVIENDSFTCINSSKLLPGVKYHALLRASCSGGKTMSASNGVTILTQKYVKNFLKVYVGENCQLLPHAEKTLSTDLNGDTIFNFTKPLRIGHVYNIYVRDNISVVLEEDTGNLTLVQSQTFGYYYKFVPFVHWPIVKTISSNNLVKSDIIDVVRCPSQHYIPVAKQSVESFWLLTGGKRFPVYFKLGIMKEDMKTSGSLHEFVLSYNSTHSRIPIPQDAKLGSSYTMVVQTCSRTYCFEPVFSESFTLLLSAPDGHISVADVDYLEGSNCFTVYLQWEAFTSDSPVIFYQWSLSEDARGRKPVTLWSTLVNRPRHQYQVNKCMSVPHDLYKTLFACVRAYTEGEQSVTKCKELKTTPGAYRKNVVYDMDSTGKYWMDIKSAITSSNLGELYKLMHESELDFGNTSAKVVGVVEYGTERSIEFFLMTRPELPGQCQSSPRCLQSLSSNTGFTEFDTRYIAANTLYYICARSNVTHVGREMFTERLEEIRTCSDGFVLDDTPPSPGVVHVSDQDGYLTDITHTQVSWDGFRDNIDATKLGYVDSIRSYSFAVGSRPGRDDIVDFSDVGLSNIAVTNITGISDGTTLYFTVKAFDQAGQSTKVTSREKTVDTSPPIVGQLMLNQQLGTKYITNDKLNIRPVKFLDDESGIHRYEISVGTSHYAADIVSTLSFTDDVDLDIPVGAMNDGHTYYATLKAINRAGLESDLVTKHFTFDRSSPTGGSIVDGDPLLKKDVNFQTDTHHLKTHWKGFDDIHSGIKFYSVGLGLQPYEDDVEPMIDVGLHTEIAWNGSYVPGQMYYAAVEACNNAGLCTKKSSNGIILDNSPPIHGLVRVGSGSRHQTFIPRSSSVRLHWHGFEDPQSGIDRFEACIGSLPGKCDIESTFNCLLQSTIMKTGLKLPANKNMYATVSAFNKVGMKVKQYSDAFTVDESPPKIVSKPTFILDYKNIQWFPVQWEPSLLGITWMFKDDESPIIDHTVTVKTHHEGHTPVENVQLGNQNSLNIPLDANNWLKSGDKYYVVVTSCNAARHCSSARSPALLIDSSPPHLGGFRPPLTWKTHTDENVSEVKLTWYGFHDQESGINKYFITVSHSYSGNELTNGEIAVVSNSTDALQQMEIKLCEKLNRDDMLILSIWAQNYAGLNSSIARVSVQALSTSTKLDSNEGILELEKHSCDAHYCNKDCTCAVIGKPCIQSTSVHNCTVLNTTFVKQQNLPTIKVFGGLKTYTQQITASSACLSGHWKLDGPNDIVSRFEWSMGLINQPIGEGVFDIKNEIPWKDVGLRQEVVHCLTSNQSLLHNHEYIIYIRAWYSSDQSAIYTSKPIQIDQTAPAVRRGKYIKDSNEACTLDFDFIDWVDTITACWDNVFSEQQSEIYNYFVSLGTSPMADDIYRRTNVGLKTQLTLANLTLSHGTKYYFSVTAFNSLGLQTFLSSDGFIVDTDIPIAGVVFNTDRHVNAAYQSSNDTFSLSWHGFIDRYSGIHKYYAALAENTAFNQSKLAYYDVGHHNSITFENVHIEHGKEYVGLVKAVDAAGHESKISVSPVKTVDTTPPEGYDCLEFQDILSDTMSCPSNGSYNYHTTINRSRTTFYRITGFMTGVGTAEFRLESMRLSMPVIVAYDGYSRFEYMFLQYGVGEGQLKLNGICSTNTNITVRLSQCSKTTPSKESAITVQQITLHDLQIKPMVLDNESQIKKILVGLGTTPGGFQIKPLSEVYRISNGVTRAPVPHGSRVYTTLTAENYAGLRSVFHAKPITMDRTAPVFHTIPTANIEDATNATRSVSVTWGVADEESGIKKCLCGLGTKPASTDLYDYAISESTHNCRMDTISVKHGDTVYANVFCVNSVELSRELSSQPLLISEEQPIASTAVLAIVPSCDHSPKLMLTNKALPVQTNLTRLLMQWSGFNDVFKIDGYEYRLKQGETLTIDWTDAGKETMATIDGLHLQSGLVYSAEVRALNVGHHTSDAVRADVLILVEGPRLSGDTMQMTVSDRTMMLDWSTVFNLNKFANASYILVTGTQNGTTDVIDNLHTTDTLFSFTIPGSTLVSPRITEIVLELTCSYATGMSSVYRTSYKLT